MKEIEYAKLSERFYAFVIDIALLILPIYAIISIVWIAIYAISEKNFPEIYNAMQTAITTPPYYHPALSIIYLIQVICTFLLIVVYFAICEVRMNGQSIGKIIMAIKVVKENSERINYKDAFIRNISRILDLFGFILILKSKKHQRPGDILSKTIVVKDK